MNRHVLVMETLEARQYLSTVSIVADFGGKEGETVQFTVSRDASSPDPLTVYFTATGSTLVVADYVDMGNSVVIPANQTSAPIAIDTIVDAEMEPTETIKITLNADAAYTVGTAASAEVDLTHCEGFFAEPKDIPNTLTDFGGCDTCAGAAEQTDKVNAGGNGFWNPEANGVKGSPFLNPALLGLGADTPIWAQTPPWSPGLRRVSRRRRSRRTCPSRHNSGRLGA